MKRRWWCDGKVKHKSRGAAEAHIRALKKRQDGPAGCIDPDSLRAYQCVTCLKWHVGHWRERPGKRTEGERNGELGR